MFNNVYFLSSAEATEEEDLDFVGLKVRRM